MSINWAVMIEEVPSDPEWQVRMAKYRRNVDWFGEHWHLFRPRYEGLCVAVSQGEVFAAEDAEVARRQALAAHPDDEPFVKYIPRERYERICACRR